MINYHLFLGVLKRMISISLTLCMIGLLTVLFAFTLPFRLIKWFLLTPSDTSNEPVYSFFHPYCANGGGGERVLWTIIHSLLRRNPNVKCVIFTDYFSQPDNDDEIIDRCKTTFNLDLSNVKNRLKFKRIYSMILMNENLYPIITLLGQAIGSMFVGIECLLFTPNRYCFFDTHGAAFTTLITKYLFGMENHWSYVHYPTISSDMIDNIKSAKNSYNNSKLITRFRIFTFIKIVYYHFFKFLYKLVGNQNDLVFVNSNWTKNHMELLWNQSVPHLLYPPCHMTKVLNLNNKKFNNFAPIPKSNIPEGDSSTEVERKEFLIISIGQFRPEKNHVLQIRSFHFFYHQMKLEERPYLHLVLIGGSRNKKDDERIENLKKLTRELNIEDSVEFKVNITFKELMMWMNKAMIGLHTMENEHFGISVVEYMANGVLTIAHSSGGPLIDIVVPYRDEPTGYLAERIAEYGHRMMKIATEMTEKQYHQIINNARDSVINRFSDKDFRINFNSLLHSKVE
ncbi:hypothetical protein SNEBB_008068 [Seison nebaliae]|nr:hypothetical protein SNEBB_008068 [Seison nebaliae]